MFAKPHTTFHSQNSFSFVPLLKILHILPKSGWLSLILWLLMIVPAKALELRVAIEEGISRITIGSSTPAIVKDASGRSLGQIDPMEGVDAKANGRNVSLSRWNGTQLWIEPSQGGYVWIGDRWYRGRTRLVRSGKGLVAINHVNLDQYLYSVLGAEMSASWPLEALKAQAVAARTYALYKRQSSRNGLYDVGDTTTWQVYKGIETEASTTQEAVRSTSGQVLTYNNQLILAVFHSAGGGHTENVENVWQQALPYLRGVADFDQGTPGHEWVKSFSSGQMGRLLGVGTVRSLTPERTSPAGRILTMRVVGSGGTKRVSGNDLRRILGLRSTLFTVNNSGGTFQLNGRGFGHGLGLSQWGAYNLAQQGYNYQQILGHYYQNTQLGNLAGK